MDEKHDRNNIKSILERAQGTEPVSTGGKLEFEFTEQSGVIFETVSDASEQLEVQEQTPSADAVKESEPKESSAPITEETAVEFTVPDVFTVDEKYNTPLRPEEAAGIWSTYVPRFTEVSETYRMADDPRPRAAQAPVQPRVSAANGDSRADIDPTAEENQKTEGVIVNIASGAADREEIKTVFKFGSPEQEARPEYKKLRTIEDEVREINELMGKHRAPESEPTLEPLQNNNIEETQPQTPTEEEPRHDYTISDSAIREAHGGASKAPSQTKYAQPPAQSTVQLPAKRSEFSAPPQRDSFKDKFLDQLLSQKVRFFASAFLAIALLVFENIGIFGIDIFRILGIPKVSGIPAILDFQFALCLFILAIPELASAIKTLIRQKVIASEISLICSLLVLGAYSITVAVIKPESYPLFGFLLAVHALATIAAAYFKKATDFESFKLITTSPEKRALDIRETRKLPEENIALDGAVDEFKSRTVTMSRTAFISEFFKTSGEVAEKSATTLLMIAVSLGIAIVAGAVSFFLLDGVISMVTAFALVFMLSMPAHSVLTHKLPYYFSGIAAKEEGCAIVGENSLAKYSAADVIIYDDTEIFGTEDVNLRSFSGDMTKGTRQMSAIFSAVGGPLDAMFSNALDRKCPPATDIVIEDDGISGKVDGHTVMAGNEEYMLRHGAKFLSGTIRQGSSSVESTKILYAAEDGVIYAHFRISYSFSESFTMILPTLREEKTVPLIVTRDPNVTNELIKTLTMGTDCIRVLKKKDVPRGDTIARKMSAGIVTVKDKASAVMAILLSKKYTVFQARLSVLELISMIVGAALGTVLALGGMAGAPSSALGLWQLLWCVALGFMSKREFTQDKDKGNQNDLE